MSPSCKLFPPISVSLSIFKVRLTSGVLTKKGRGVPYYHLLSYQSFPILSFSIFFVSWEELSLIESNEHVCDFCKPVIFEKQRHCGAL